MIEAYLEIADISAIEELPKHLAMASRETLEQILERASRLSQLRLRPGGGGPTSQSGRLARSLGWSVRQSGEQLRGQIFSDAPYAAVHEYGATIQAKRAEYLKFRVQGRWVQVRRVRIPARPFVGPGLEEALVPLADLLLQNLENQ